MSESDGFMNRQLKSFDIFKKLPKEMSKGSIVGVILTLFCFILCIILVASELNEYQSYSVGTSLTVDHKLENQSVIVHIDVSFKRMPCHLLGLDVVDCIGTHKMNLHGNLKKYQMDKNGNDVKEVPFVYPEETLVEDFKKSLDNEEGCRLKGDFDVLLAPGNFHIGFHSFGNYLNKILTTGIHWEPKMEHQINHLSFGTEHSKSEWTNYQNTYGLKELNTLEGFNTKQVTPSSGPFSYHYKLLIFPTNLIASNKAKYQVYQYRTFWNLAYIENGYNYLASFDYELSSIIMEHRLWRKSFSELLIDLSGIVGGIVSATALIHIILQKTLVKLLWKDSIGKLG